MGIKPPEIKTITAELVVPPLVLYNYKHILHRIAKEKVNIAE